MSCKNLLLRTDQALFPYLRMFISYLAACVISIVWFDLWSVVVGKGSRQENRGYGVASQVAFTFHFRSGLLGLLTGLLGLPGNGRDIRPCPGGIDPTAASRVLLPSFPFPNTAGPGCSQFYQARKVRFCPWYSTGI